MINPHGGLLINRFHDKYEVDDNNKRVLLDKMALRDLELIANGAYSPLSGFMVERDYLSVVKSLRLANNLPWSIPITLAVDSATATSVSIGETVNLAYENIVYGVMTVEDMFTTDKLDEAKLVYQTTDPKHPGVKKLLERPNNYIGGPITLVKSPKKNNFYDYLLTPSESREKFNRLGWKTIVGFQTRNPIHRAHEYIQKSALETVEG